MTSLSELEAEFDTLSTDVMLPLRVSKVVDAELVNRLNRLMDEFQAKLKDVECVPRLLVGKLWFHFVEMLAEAEHTRSPDDILMTAWDYQSRLRRIFGPDFSSAPQGPDVPQI